VLVPPTRVGLPNRDTDSNASPRSAFGAPHRVRIDVHGSKDRVKDAFCRAHATISRAYAGACALFAHARRRSPPRSPSDIRCHRRAAAPGGYPLQHDGPTEALVPTTPREECRLSQDRDAFHRHDTRRSHAKGVIPPALAPALSLTPPTRFPRRESVLWMGIARSRCGHPLAVNLESADTFSTRWTFRAWG